MLWAGCGPVTMLCEASDEVVSVARGECSAVTESRDVSGGRMCWVVLLYRHTYITQPPPAPDLYPHRADGIPLSVRWPANSPVGIGSHGDAAWALPVALLLTSASATASWTAPAPEARRPDHRSGYLDNGWCTCTIVRAEIGCVG